MTSPPAYQTSARTSIILLLRSSPHLISYPHISLRMAGGAQTSRGDASMLFKRHSYRIRALYPMCIGCTVSFVFLRLLSSLPPMTAHDLPLEDYCSMTVLLVLMRPADPVPCLMPHYQDGGCGPSLALLIGHICWLVHMVDRRLKVVLLESFNPSMRLNVLMVLVNLLFFPLVSWAERMSVFLSSVLPAGGNLFRKNKTRSTQRSWDGKMRNGPANMYCESLDPPLSIPIR